MTNWYRWGFEAYERGASIDRIDRLNPFTTPGSHSDGENALEASLEWLRGWKDADTQYGNMSITEIKRLKDQEKALQDYYPGKDLDDCENLEEVKAWIKENLC